MVCECSEFGIAAWIAGNWFRNGPIWTTNGHFHANYPLNSVSIDELFGGIDRCTVCGAHNARFLFECCAGDKSGTSPIYQQNESQSRLMPLSDFRPGVFG